MNRSFALLLSFVSTLSFAAVAGAQTRVGGGAQVPSQQLQQATASSPVVRAGGNAARPGPGTAAPHLDRARMPAPLAGGSMPSLTPGQIFSFAVGQTTSIAPDVHATLFVNDATLTIGDGGRATASLFAHTSPAGTDQTVQVVLLAESATQDYSLQFDVSPGSYNVSVDAYWAGTDAAHPDHDELLTVATQTVGDGHLRVFIDHDPRWPTAPLAYYAFVSSNSTWTFQRVTGSRR